MEFHFLDTTPRLGEAPQGATTKEATADIIVITLAILVIVITDGTAVSTTSLLKLREESTTTM